jgi:hypothetical protein
MLPDSIGLAVYLMALAAGIGAIVGGLVGLCTSHFIGSGTRGFGSGAAAGALGFVLGGTGCSLVVECQHPYFVAYGLAGALAVAYETIYRSRRRTSR